MTTRARLARARLWRFTFRKGRKTLLNTYPTEIEVQDLSDDDLISLRRHLKNKLKEARATTEEAHLWVAVNKDIDRRTKELRKRLRE